ncbi:MAG TPA: pyridoxal phosphate-dependent aminotransferase [Gemmatimonadales bacterium]|nr:pyridoxal phosphate-dependent aminotransferase [Gemmatimonadales bacterium]
MTRVIRLPDPLSPNLAHLRASETIATSAEAKRRQAAGEDVLDLAVGEPDFDTPAPAAQAGILAIQRGYTRYPPNPGLLELRRAIAENLSRQSGGSREISPDSVIVSTGSKQALFNACFSLFGPKDRVLIPAPSWVSYPQIVHLSRAEPVMVPGATDWSLKVSAEDLERRTDKLVRGLILCSPCNPTGAVYTLSELKAIAGWARKHDAWIIADEIYRRIFFGAGSAPSFLDLPGDTLERTVIVTGASKAYAMTGWRVGAAVAPAHLVKAMANLQSHVTSGANHPAQWAAVTAFSDPEVERQVQRMVEAFGRRRDRVVSRFRDEVPGIEFVEPHGAFYFFFRVDGIGPAPGQTGSGFCEELLRREAVALVPGAAFGDDRWVRLSYAVSDRELDAALDRILRFVQSFGD